MQNMQFAVWNEFIERLVLFMMTELGVKLIWNLTA